MRHLIMEGVNPLIAEVRLCESALGFHINHVAAKLKGGARRVMGKLCYNADWLGVALTLNAVPLRTELYKEPWDQIKLVNWYESFGFKRLEPTEFMKNLMCRYARR